MKLKSKCCKKYQKKASACKQCPIMARLNPKQKKRLAKAKKKLKK